MIKTAYYYIKQLYAHLKSFRWHILTLSILQGWVAIIDLVGMTFLYLVLVFLFSGKIPENFQNILQKYFSLTFYEMPKLGAIFVTVTFTILMIRVILGVIQGYYTSWLGRTVLMFLTTNLNKKILLSPYKEMVSRPSGELALAIGDESYTVGQSIIDISDVFSNAMILVFYFIVLGVISKKYTIFLLLSLMIIGSSTYFTIRLGKQYGDLLVKQSKKLSSIMFDLINNMKAIRLFNNEAEEVNNYKSNCMEYRRFHVKKDLYVELTTYVPNAVLYIIIIVAYFLLMFHPSEPPIFYDSNLALLLFGYTTRILFGCKILVSKGGAFLSNIQSGKDIFEILNIPDEKKVDLNSKIAPRLENRIQFENVAFQHKGQNKSLFENLSLSMPINKHIAIVGETGCGKTTLLDLLMGLYKPLSGKILVSDQDLADLDQRIWRAKVIYVNQEISLFNDTVFKNLTYGASNKNMDQVVYYSKLALCHEFISVLPDGYETVLHYQGKNISGGQKQRLLVAHALICEPEVLILDESTSSLDEYTQSIVMQNIKKLYHDKTLIVVTHKSEMLALFDHIIRLDKGQVVYQGNFKGYQEKFFSKVSL
jgi:subfamily B ATP-binding cassette protein MsbA